MAFKFASQLRKNDEEYKQYELEEHDTINVNAGMNKSMIRTRDPPDDAMIWHFRD